MDEMNSARGERNFWPASGGSVLTGSGGVGWRGGRRVEAEREREREREGSPSTAWSSAVAWRRRG
jgi:hypothetical protein